jgi:hypothetical protein
LKRGAAPWDVSEIEWKSGRLRSQSPFFNRLPQDVCTISHGEYRPIYISAKISWMWNRSNPNKGIDLVGVASLTTLVAVPTGRDVCNSLAVLSMREPLYYGDTELDESDPDECQRSRLGRDNAFVQVKTWIITDVDDLPESCSTREGDAI